MEKVRIAIERSTKALTLRPSLGRGSCVSRTRMLDGLKCEVEEGPWKFVTDMPKEIGGDATGPTPGVFGRAALGGCLAIGYMMQAAKHGVPITALEVEIQADYDDGALLGTSDSPVGYIEVRYVVTVESGAPEGDILKMLDEGDAHSPYLDVFARPQPCRRSVRIVPPREA